nr:hypothetical protein [Tanacetum cinerariifolium]
GGDPNSKDNDPSNDGQGPANEPTIPAELAAGHKHDYGAVAAARQGDFVNPQRASSSTIRLRLLAPQQLPRYPAPMKILLTGSNGLLGQKLVALLRQQPEVAVVATARGINRLADIYPDIRFVPLD